MAKTCIAEDCNNPVFAKLLCLYHQWMRTDKKKKKLYNKKIAPVSDKRLGELAIYRPRRDKYLKENTVCEVRECSNPSTHIHHKNGRVGKMVYNVFYFMAVCNECHPKKIHENPGPSWSRPEGYLI